MDKLSLTNGLIIEASINNKEGQDYLEIQLKNGEIIIVTASVGGRLKIGKMYRTVE